MQNQNLINSARNCVKECMGIEADENVLIITDAKRLNVAEALRQAAMEIDANVSVVLLPDPSHRRAKPITNLDEMLVSALKVSDVVLTPITDIESEFGPFRKPLMEMASKKKFFRLGHMIDIEEESLIDGGLTANYREIEELTDLLAEILSKAGKITIVTGSGEYKLEANLGGWEELAISDCGILRKVGSLGNLPAGEAYIAPRRYYDINGMVSINLFADPVGSLVNPIILKIVKGSVAEINGTEDDEKHNEFKERLRKAEKEADEQKIPRENVRKIAEIAIGTNPKAKVGRVAIETEKLKGTAHIALGDNSFFGGLTKAPRHYDLIISRPTIKIGGIDKEQIMIMKNGEIEPIPILRAEFEENFNQFDGAGISNEFFVRRATKDVEIIDWHLYKKWMDFEGREHKTKVGDNQTAVFAARIWENITDKIKITILADQLGENVDNVKKVLKVLRDYLLVNIETKDMFTVIEELKNEVRMNLEKVGQDLTKITAIDEQTKLLITSTSEDLKKLNEYIFDLNIEGSLTLIGDINGKIDQLDKSRVSGRIGIQSLPPYFAFTADVDAKVVIDTIKKGLNKIRVRLMEKRKEF
jgi:leucyl aminopeptidase (aminopeptidase T)